MKKAMHVIFVAGATLLLYTSAQAQSRSGYSRQNTNQQPAEKKTYTDAEIAKIMDIKSYPDYDADKAEIDRIYKLYNSGKQDGRIERVEKLKASKQIVADIGKKYTEYWSVYWDQMKKLEPMDAEYEKLKTPVRSYGPKTSFIDKVQDEVEKKLKQQGNPAYTVPKMLSDAEEKAKGNVSLLTEPDFKSADYQNKQKMADSKWTSVELDMDDINYDIALAAYQSGDESSTVKDLVKKRDETQTAINGYKKDFNTKFVAACMTQLAAIKQPADVYVGADKEQLRKLIQEEWKKGYCKANTLVKIIFTSTKWDRDNRRVYENASNDGSVVSAHNESDSYLNVSIIYKDAQDAPEIMNMWEGYLDKDNIRGGFTYHICPEGGYWPKKILAKNVK